MEEKFDNTLNINFTDGTNATINVLDIINSYAFNKSFMIYTFSGNEGKIFASVLNESDTSYSLDTITSQDEINYITAEIDRVVAEEDERQGGEYNG